MFLILGIMFCGVASGTLLRNRRFSVRWAGSAILPVICLLLLCMGFSVGSNREVVRCFPTLGWQACIITVGALLGSLIGAKVVYTSFFKKNPAESDSERDDTALEPDMDFRTGETERSGSSSDSVRILLSFLIGVLLGIFSLWVYDALPGSVVARVFSLLMTHAERGSVWVLYGLMFLVGISVGGEGGIFRRLRFGGLKIWLVPVATLLGTWIGVALLSPLVGDRTMGQCLMIGSGFGYYSLSSVLIGQSSGVTLGTISLIANVFRELVTLTSAPFLVRLFGPLAPICAGGATTMDTTLPVIARFSGKNFIFVAIVHGIVVDFSVPVFVTLFSLL